MTPPTQTESAFAANVVGRLLGHLDELSEPFLGRSAPDGELRETRDWLYLHCFSGDHDLFDDIVTVLSRGRALARDGWSIAPPKNDVSPRSNRGLTGHSMHDKRDGG